MPDTKKASVDEIVYDYKGKPYLPRFIAHAADQRAWLEVTTKRGKVKKVRPRKCHRDGRKFVSGEIDENNRYIAWSSGEEGKGYLTSPKYLNSQRNLLKTSVEVLFEQFSKEQLDGIVGKFNETPIYEFNGMEKHFSENCPFKSQCDECYIWGPYQYLTWGRIVNEEFVPLSDSEVISCEPMSLWDFKEAVRNKIPILVWEIFRDKLTKAYADLIPQDCSIQEKIQALEKIAALKLIDNNQAMSNRTNLNSIKCYGISSVQFGTTIETRCKGNDFEIWLSINRRHPVCFDRIKRRVIKSLFSDSKNIVLDIIYPEETEEETITIDENIESLETEIDDIDIDLEDYEEDDVYGDDDDDNCEEFFYYDEKENE